MRRAVACVLLLINACRCDDELHVAPAELVTAEPPDEPPSRLDAGHPPVCFDTAGSVAPECLPPPFDAGAPALDVGSDIDAGTTELDAGSIELDAGSVIDAGEPVDLGAVDLGVPDLGTPDAGPPDLGPPDLGPPDLGPPPICAPGATRSCYPGAAGTQGIGLCHAGSQICASDGQSWGACQGAVTPASEVCGNGADEDCNGADPACPPVEIPLFLFGDCVYAQCPAATPYPVGCNVLMTQGDPRGCVANQYGSPLVFFKAGNQCDAGFVGGSLFCSSAPGQPLGPNNCPINKLQPMWVSSPGQCPQ